MGDPTHDPLEEGQHVGSGGHRMEREREPVLIIVSARSSAPIAGSVRGPARLDDGRTSLNAKYDTS
jgi:hypothetical protein